MVRGEEWTAEPPFCTPSGVVRKKGEPEATVDEATFRYLAVTVAWVSQSPCRRGSWTRSTGTDRYPLPKHSSDFGLVRAQPIGHRPRP